MYAAHRSSRPGLLLGLSLALAGLIATSGPALAQATKTESKAKVAKEKAKAKAAGLVDLNSASTEELMELPGVGEVTARKIVDGRPHKAVADLAAAGVSASEIEKLKPLVEVKALPSPVDVNLDSLDKIETLPGISATLAKEIVAGRPHAGYESIAALKGIGPAKLEKLKGRLRFGEEAASVAKTRTKAAAKVDEAKVAEAQAELKTAEAKEGLPKVKAKVEEARAKAKVAEAKVEEKVKTKVAEEKAKKDTPKSKLAPGEKVNINTATREELDELFGIGEVRSQAIIDYRTNEKKFETIEDIMKVKGIKEGEFSKIKDRITVK